MEAQMREWFNAKFTEKKYRKYLAYLESLFPGMVQFRIAETPIFIPTNFQQQMLDTCEYIIDVIKSPDFKSLTANAVNNSKILGESEHPHFLVFDFGICEDVGGNISPKLIELQGFPSLFAYQLYQDLAARDAYDIPEEWQIYLNHYDKEKVVELLKQIIIADANPENVVLLDLYPEQQKTKVDFSCTERELGIQVVCLTELLREGNILYYCKDGEQKVKVDRIYNRLIFDEVRNANDPTLNQQLTLLDGNLEVEWVTHPNWFYRVSKYLLPFLHHPNIPKAYFLDRRPSNLQDLSNYVLKPLFSFAGRGVTLDITSESLRVENPSNYIIQEKVTYAPCIKTLDTPAKAEIRIFYLWPTQANRPIATHNLARLSKDKMIGVGYNTEKTWVGGSFAYSIQKK